ncbi:unnamed protein product, partial [Mesorhabditis spiculigera]
MSAGDVANFDKQACDQANEFLQLYYEVIDRRRERLGFMYRDDSTIVWNGNPTNGVDAIGKFLTALPETQHTVQSMDVQRLSPVAVRGYGSEALTALVAGIVDVGGMEHGFTQSMILVIDDDSKKPKILSDRFRYVD